MSSTVKKTLFEEVCSKDILGFGFAGNDYAKQLQEAYVKTNAFCAVKVERKTLHNESGDMDVVWCTHNFQFLGGSLGSAEGTSELLFPLLV
jgi:acetyl-CoA carboxylase beta subunit